MNTYILLLTILLLLPAAVLWAERKSRIIRWISSIVFCYLIGIFIGNIPGLSLDQEFLKAVTGVSVFLAIPLLLFSANFLRFLKHARPAFHSFFLGILAVIISTVLAFLIFRDNITEPGAVSGMMIGVYTGGTPNMSAIGIVLDVDPEVFILLNSADIFFSGIYFIFLLTAGKSILGMFFPAYVKKWKGGTSNNWNDKPSGVLQRNSKKIFLGLFLSIMVVAISVGISFIATRNISMPLILLGITSLGILASFLPSIQQLPYTYSSANYLLLVFALGMGAMANFSELISATSTLFYFCGTVLICSVLIHLLLAYIFRIDRDTVIITSTAAIFGPAFIGPVAKVINNKELIVSGITLGLIGYAMGNYLGLALAFILK